MPESTPAPTPTYWIKGDHVERDQGGVSEDYRRDGGGNPTYYIKGDEVERDEGGGGVYWRRDEGGA